MQIWAKKRWLWGCLVCALLWMISGGRFAFAEETWWNEDWQYRKKLSFDTSPTGADIAENFSRIPLLIRLHSGNMNFTNAMETGEDIRFVASDAKTLLHHHMESYDGIDELGLVWVSVPRLSGASNTDFIWMYYGNKDAVGGQAPRKTFGNVGAVYHFSEIDQTPQDSGLNSVSVTEFSGGQGMPAVVASGLALNGVNDGLTLSDMPALSMERGFTVSGWIRIPAPLESAVLFDRGSTTGRLTIAVENTRLYCRVLDGDGGVHITEKTADLTPGTWQPVAVTGTSEGVVAVYVQGMKIDWINLGRRLPSFAGDMRIGSSREGDRFFAGELDEFRLYPTALSSDRIRLDYANQGPGTSFVTAGLEEVGGGGGMPVFYLGTVFRNITLDGWVVIVSLLILGIMSGGVILTKGISLYWMAKENRHFQTLKKTGTDGLAIFEGDEDDFENSSLYRLFVTGKKVVERGGKEEEIRLSSRDVEYLKVEMEKGLIEETRNLNAWLIILTLSISGGPFLGLLGTVWGVMNTFAAMAEAGEANIMAIAPGVASALSTTVFGLIVAIPALFGYNYLSTKIRQITIDMSVYVDDYTLMANQCCGDLK